MEQLFVVVLNEQIIYKSLISLSIIIDFHQEIINHRVVSQIDCYKVIIFEVLDIIYLKVIDTVVHRLI